MQKAEILSYNNQTEEEAVKRLYEFRQKLLDIIQNHRMYLHVPLKENREEQWVVGFWADKFGGVDLPDLEIWETPRLTLFQAKLLLEGSEERRVKAATRYMADQLVEGTWHGGFDPNQDRLMMVANFLQVAGAQTGECIKQIVKYKEGAEHGAEIGVTVCKVSIAVLSTVVGGEAFDAAKVAGYGMMASSSFASGIGVLTTEAEEIGTQIGEMRYGKREWFDFDFRKLGKVGLKSAVTGFVGSVVGGKMGELVEAGFVRFATPKLIEMGINLDSAAMKFVGSMGANWLTSAAVAPFTTSAGLLVDKTMGDRTGINGWGDFFHLVLHDMKDSVEMGTFLHIAGMAAKGKSGGLKPAKKAEFEEVEAGGQLGPAEKVKPTAELPRQPLVGAAMEVPTQLVKTMPDAAGELTAAPETMPKTAVPAPEVAAEGAKPETATSTLETEMPAPETATLEAPRSQEKALKEEAPEKAPSKEEAGVQAMAVAPTSEPQSVTRAKEHVASAEKNLTAARARYDKAAADHAIAENVWADSVRHLAAVRDALKATEVRRDTSATGADDGRRARRQFDAAERAVKRTQGKLEQRARRLNQAAMTAKAATTRLTKAQMRLQKATDGKSARQALRADWEKNIRPDQVKRLGARSNEDLHHAIELQVADLFPEVFTHDELLGDANMRVIPLEAAPAQQKLLKQAGATPHEQWPPKFVDAIDLVDVPQKSGKTEKRPMLKDRGKAGRPSALHGSKIRTMWNEIYERITNHVEAEQAQGRMAEGSPEYRDYVRHEIEHGRDYIEWALNAFWGSSKQDAGLR
jgi:hypothetical protein